MIARRRFLKTFITLGSGIAFLPEILFRKGFSEIPKSNFEAVNNGTLPKNWLFGYPKRGCSTPNFPFSHLEQAEKDLF